MRHSSTVSIIFGLLLLILFPVFITEVEQPKQLCHEEHYPQMGFKQTLTVCINPDMFHYTSYVSDSVLMARVEVISDSLRKDLTLH